MFYEPGDLLLTDIVSNVEGDEDDRQMCFATTSQEDALHWPYHRGIRHGGDLLYVYEVELLDPQVDVNMHRPGALEHITSVMSSQGRVIRLVQALAKADYPGAFFG